MLRAWAFVSCGGTDPRPGSGWLWVRRYALAAHAWYR